ncbi:hypothetical protein DV515_00017512, partial [Chloebia gouldiae]
MDGRTDGRREGRRAGGGSAGLGGFEVMRAGGTPSPSPRVRAPRGAGTPEEPRCVTSCDTDGEQQPCRGAGGTRGDCQGWARGTGDRDLVLLLLLFGAQAELCTPSSALSPPLPWDWRGMTPPAAPVSTLWPPLLLVALMAFGECHQWVVGSSVGLVAPLGHPVWQSSRAPQDPPVLPHWDRCPHDAGTSPGGFSCSSDVPTRSWWLPVEVEVESMDKAGNFIGWLHIEGVNLSVALVEQALSRVHFTAERSPYCKALLAAQDAAKQRKEK